MEPMKVRELPIEYNIDKELLKLISEANARYGEYKSYLRNASFDPNFFLNSLILNESLKSTQIEGTQISQDELYYLKYMPQTDDNLEIQNLFTKYYLIVYEEMKKNREELEAFKIGLALKVAVLKKQYLCHQFLRMFQFF